MKKAGRLLVLMTVIAVMILAVSISVFADSSSGTLNGDISWTLDEDGNLEITGSGPIPDYSYNGSPFRNMSFSTVSVGSGITAVGNCTFHKCNGLETVTLPEGLERIGGYAFSEISSLKSVDFPEGLKVIGNEAFSRCSSLESFILPDSVEELGEYACYQCPGITEVDLSDNIEIIPRYAFYDCTSLTSLHLPDNIKSINEYAFSGDSNISSIDLADGIENIGTCAFNGCRQVTSLTLPDSLKTIGNSAFFYLSMRSLVIPDSVTELGERAFSNCEELRSLKISKSLKEIPTEAFSYCTKLKAIEIPDGVESLGNGAFGGCTDIKRAVVPSSVKKMEWCFAECFGLDEVKFEGDFPAPLNGSFYGCNLTAYYPIDNTTWTEDILDSGYGGKVKWVGYCITHDKAAAVKENVKAATALKAGSYDLVTYCSRCGEELSRETVSVKKLTPTIKLSATKKTLKKGKTFTLKVTGLAKGDSVKSFKSSNKSVAAVSSKGKISAKKKGKAVITVTLKSGKTATCKITVN